MKNYCFFLLVLFVSVSAISQNKLNDYSFVIVPDQFEFLNEKDKYQLNSITEFLFNKHGFNAFLSDEIPNANRCEGLYADVVKERSILGTRLKIVLRDCNGNTVHESEVGKSKFKEYHKAYQDALREAFKSIERLNVHQKDLILLEANPNPERTLRGLEENETQDAVVPFENENPASKFSSYNYNGNSYMLQKTAEGYSLYEETESAENALVLKGKIVQMGTIVKYMDTSGNVFDASFDASQNLTIQNKDAVMVYKVVN